jgi:gentisate 1,2-dioxygenase
LREPAIGAGANTRDVEVYSVLEGLAQVGDQDYLVKTGGTFVVPAFKEYRLYRLQCLHSLLESLRVIAVFAPAENSRAGFVGKST